MKLNNLTTLTTQQCQWIKEAYFSIMEDPEAFGYDSLEKHENEIVDVIKEDVEQAFGVTIDNELIINEIRKWQRN